MVRVLVVEDSMTARELLVHILSRDPELSVIASVSSGEEALELLSRDRPDVVTMDIGLPGIDGIEATRRIMESAPVPVVIVSASLEPGEVSTAFRALEAGALMVMEKPVSILSPDYERVARELVQRVKAMAEVKVVRRHRRGASASQRPARGARDGRLPDPTTGGPARIVAMGGSTGAPTVIQRILATLPPGLSVPTVIVQHMASGFTQGMARWLSESTGRSVELASDGRQLQAGRSYLAPEGAQMALQENGSVLLKDDPAEHGLRPSVSYLFRSVARTYGGNAIGVLLTGMGVDGAAELADLRRLGALTIVQDRESSVVYGMPGAALRMNGASLVLDPEGIAQAIARAVGAAP